MASNKIVYNGKTYTGDFSIMSGNMFLENSLANDELTVDTLSATIENSVETGTKFVPKGSSGMLTADKKMFYVLPIIRVLIDDLSQYIYGATVLYYRDDVLMGKFYMSSVKRVSKFQFEISCVSAIGLLDNTKHYGGVYDGTLMKDLLADIIGGIIPYTLDPIFLNLPVFGWLPVATRRENLHQLLFAEGATIKKDANGDLVFTYLKSGAATEIGDDRIFMGGTVDYATQVDTVIVIEHSYIAYENQEPVSLYEDFVPDQTITTPNGNIVSGVLVQFNDPTFALTIENGTILEQGANYAVLKSGGFCKLFGKPYSHTTRENIAKKPQSRSFVSIADNTATIDGATLVSLANGENVAKRALSYYGYAETTNAGFVVSDERPGESVVFNDPFGRQRVGFVQSMDIAFSGILKARARLVSGFKPVAPGNYYNTSIVLTGSGEFSIPENVQTILVVVIEGGQGGSGGLPGEDAEGAESWASVRGNFQGKGISETSGGKGGAGGAKGISGKVYQTELSVTPGRKISYIAGVGGTGGKSGGTGAFGTESIFGDFSSSQGAALENGYIDIFTGKILAKNGLNGISGGGGAGGSGSQDAENPVDGGIVTYDGIVYRSGRNGKSISGEKEDYYGKKTYRSAGRYGGGPAVGSDGSNGLDATDAYYGTSQQATLIIEAALGGEGANASAPNKAGDFGCGGNGGHGGGGGGGFGVTYFSWPKIESGQYSRVLFGKPASGGLGSDGSDGGDGCIIVYY